MLLGFPEFIEGISQFSVKGNKDAKLQCECNFKSYLGLYFELLTNLKLVISFGICFWLVIEILQSYILSDWVLKLVYCDGGVNCSYVC